MIECSSPIYRWSHAHGKLLAMEFVTLHDLSKEFDLPARVVRYRFHQLRQAGNLKEGDDWRRDEYVDDQHFVWKINPLSFMRETGLTPVSQRRSSIPFPDAVTKTEPLVNEPVNQPVPVVDKVVNQESAAVTKPLPSDIRADTNDTSHRFEHDVIDFLKEQIHVKDQQLHARDEQLRAVNDMNVKLMGATLQQSNKIEELLRLSAAQPEMVSDNGDQNSNVVNDAVNTRPPSGNQPVNEFGNQQGNARAA
jgi:hypothetical protein